MKKLNTLLLFLPFVAMAQSKPELFSTITEKDFVAEGIAYHASGKSFYVGSIYKQKIVKISSSGRVTDFVTSRQDSIGQVVGLRVDETNHHLWVCNNKGEGVAGGTSQIHQYDLKTGKLIRQYKHQAAGEKHLFNDLVLVNGDAYITDSEFKAIYKVNSTTHRLDLFLQSDQFDYANGITALPGSSTLVVATNFGLMTIDVNTKAVSSIPFLNYYVLGIDGLYYDKDSFIGIQNVTYPPCINQYFLNDNHSMITGARVILSDHADFNVPTTGAIADGWFYYIANSQLNNYSKGSFQHPEKLEATKIMRVKIQ